MKTPIFLTFEEVLQTHSSQIACFGGSDGIRDTGLLKSALAMPESMFGGQYLHRDIYEMAAAYLFHLTSNHPFLDGNKRIGIVVAIVFLKMNDYEFTADETELEHIVMETAQGRTDKAVLTEFFRTNAREKRLSSGKVSEC